MTPQIGDLTLKKYFAIMMRVARFCDWVKNRDETVTLVVSSGMPDAMVKLFRIGTGATQVIRAAFEGTATLHTEWLVLIEPSAKFEQVLHELRHIQMAAKDGQVYPEIWEF